VKNKEKYLVELSESEVKSIGYRRWCDKNKVAMWLIVVAVLSVAIMVLTTKISVIEEEWSLIIGLIPIVWYCLCCAWKLPKAEKMFLEEIKKSQVTNLR
jgi:quinol-cytochrome oxidoreductase complex cytochrome b subunit